MRTRTCILCCLFLIVGGTFLASTASAQTPALEIRIDTVEATVYDTAVEVPVYLATSEDSVASFTLWIRLTHPTLCSLRTEIVTAGTLIEDWQYIHAQYIGDDGNDLRVVGVHNVIFPVIGLPPQSGETPFFKLVLDIKEPGSVFMSDEVDLDLITQAPDFFTVSDPSQRPIGYQIDTVPDTSFWRCLAWEGEECLDWQQVSLPPYDSISVDFVERLVLDTAEVHVFDGLVRVPELPCGDINGDNFVDLSDLIALVSYLFQGGAPPAFVWAANVNGSENLDIDLSDLIYLVNFLFQGGQPPQCY